MTIQTITLDLPESLMQRVQMAAKALKDPVEKVLTDVIAATLPDLADAPVELYEELVHMSFLSDQQLWEIATALMQQTQQEQLTNLSEIGLQRRLTQSEQRRRDELITEYDRVLVRKARAYALLSARSGKLLLTNQDLN